MRHMPIRELGYAIAFLIVVATLYAGAYFAMVERTEFRFTGSPLAFPSGDEYSFVEYRFGGDAAQSFFAPMHAVDRLLRPKLWQYEIQQIRPHDFEPFDYGSLRR
jgi:hypothetical protein